MTYQWQEGCFFFTAETQCLLLGLSGRCCIYTQCKCVVKLLCVMHPITNLSAKQNGMQRKEPQLDRDSSKRHDHKMSRQDGSVSTNRGTSIKGQGAFQQSLAREMTTNKEGGLRGTKTPSLPPPSSLTPQQIQKLRAARAARAAAASGAPPAKKKALNPNAFYGSAAARILQRKGEPKRSLPLKYTSSYVDEMLDYLQMEGMNSVDDLYSDEEEMDNFIASDDEDFIDDSEEIEDYSSAISKIFGYDRSRQVHAIVRNLFAGVPAYDLIG